jgi:hypothetical protein
VTQEVAIGVLISYHGISKLNELMLSINGVKVFITLVPTLYD